MDYEHRQWFFNSNSSSTGYYWLEIPMVNEDRLIISRELFAISWLTICANIAYLTAVLGGERWKINKTAADHAWNTIMTIFSMAVFLNFILGYANLQLEHVGRYVFGLLFLALFDSQIKCTSFHRLYYLLFII